MIYSRFGTQLTLINKTESEGGRVSVQATADGSADIHDYNVVDLKADDGMNEINAAVAKLPSRVVGTNTQRGHGKFR
jgi:hypothetical protein